MREAVRPKIKKKYLPFSYLHGSRNLSGGFLTFLVVNIFHRGPYGPPLRRSDCFLWMVRTSISKATYSNMIFHLSNTYTVK